MPKTLTDEPPQRSSLAEDPAACQAPRLGFDARFEAGLRRLRARHRAAVSQRSHRQAADIAHVGCRPIVSDLALCLSLVEEPEADAPLQFDLPSSTKISSPSGHLAKSGRCTHYLDSLFAT